MWLEQWHVKPDYPFLNSGGFFNYLYHCTIVNCNLFWTLSLLSVHCNTGIPLLHPHDCLQTAAANSQQVNSNPMCQKYLSTFTTATSTINTAPPSCFTCITFYIASIILLPFIRLLVTGIGILSFFYVVYFLLLSICITWLPSILVSSSHMWQDIFYLSNHHYIYSASGIVSYHILPGSIVSNLSSAGFLNTLLEVFSHRTALYSNLSQYHLLKDFLRRSRDCAIDFWSINNLC